MPTIDDQINAFLSGSPHAVVGASRVRTKYGNMVLRTYLQHARPAYPVNPSGGMIEGLQACATLRDIPEPVHGISIITPPPVTERIIDQAAELGIHHIWMQPGAESPTAIQRAHALRMNLIAQGPCILVVLGFQYGR